MQEKRKYFDQCVLSKYLFTPNIYLFLACRGNFPVPSECENTRKPWKIIGMLILFFGLFWWWIIAIMYEIWILSEFWNSRYGKVIITTISRCSFLHLNFSVIYRPNNDLKARGPFVLSSVTSNHVYWLNGDLSCCYY